MWELIMIVHFAHGFVMLTHTFVDDGFSDQDGSTAYWQCEDALYNLPKNVSGECTQSLGKGA
jgi:hypothetical protein